MLLGEPKEPRPYAYLVKLAFATSETNAFFCMSQGHQEAMLTQAAQLVLAPLAVAAALAFLVVKNGKALVCRPQLCPTLSQPW